MASERSFVEDVAKVSEQFNELMSKYRPQLENGRLVLETILDLLKKEGGSAPMAVVHKLRQELLESEEALQSISNRALVAVELLRNQNKAIAPMFSAKTSQDPPPDKTP